MIATAPRDRTKTNQEVETPDDLFGVLDREFDFHVDLAASKENAKCTVYVTKEQDSLTIPWRRWAGWLWLNPPFSKIEPWAEHCWLESCHGAKIVMLVPGAHGSNWYRKWVEGKAAVRDLNGRVIFKGHTKPYPKDLMACVYAPGIFPIVHTWDWRAAIPGRRRAIA